MPIAVPVAGEEVSASTFGAPVANQLNTNTTDIAKLLNNSARGMIAQSRVTTSGPTVTTTLTDLPGSNVTFTPVMGRLYRLTAQGLGVVNTATNVMTIRIRNSVNAVLTGWSMAIGAANIGWTFYMSDVWAPANTSPVTFKLSYFIQFGGGTCYVYADNTGGGATFLQVDDIGPATQI